MKNSNLKPQLRKKNGVWIKVLVPVLCVVAGASAMAGLIAGVPAISNAVIKQDTNLTNPGTSTTPTGQSKLTELQNKLNTANAQLAVRNEQIADKDLQVSNLTDQVESLEQQLQAFSDYEEIKSQLELKTAELEQAKADDASDTEAISELQQQVIDLTVKKQELETECEGYRELLGSDVTYAEMVVQLQNALSTANSQLETITAERDSLLAEKETLTQQVANLTIQVNALQAQLNNYVGTENVDKLKVESYNGTWYLNSTYEDYFIITDGVVVRGNNIDSGAIQVINNQMHMLLGSGKQAVYLSDNATVLTLEDGSVYTKYVINISQQTAVNMTIVAGEYSAGEEVVILNNDYTLSYFNGSETFYGAYEVSAEQKNIGGNITLTHTITATINTANGSETKTFKLINDNGVLDGEVDYFKIKNVINPATHLTYTNESKFTNCYALTLQFKEPLAIDATSKQLLLTFTDCKGSQLSNCFKTYSSLTSGSFTKTGTCYVNYITSNYTDLNEFNSITIYFANKSTASLNIDALNSVTYGGVAVDFNLVSLDKLGTEDTICLTGKMLELYNATQLEDVNYINCNPIIDYYTGTFTNDTLSVELTADSAVVTPADAEAITATSYTVTAVTDGTNITHTITIVYSDTEGTEHTLTYNIVNNATTSQNGLLDASEIELTKN